MAGHHPCCGPPDVGVRSPAQFNALTVHRDTAVGLLSRQAHSKRGSRAMHMLCKLAIKFMIDISLLTRSRITLLILGALCWADVIRGKPGSGLALVLLGFITFLPGLRAVSGNCAALDTNATWLCQYFCPSRCMRPPAAAAGYYQARIAYYTWRGYPGYGYDEIPEM